MNILFDGPAVAGRVTLIQNAQSWTFKTPNVGETVRIWIRSMQDDDDLYTFLVESDANPIAYVDLYDLEDWS